MINAGAGKMNSMKGIRVMRMYLSVLLAVLSLLGSGVPCTAAGAEDVPLSEIAANIGAYKSRTITLRLKLKELRGDSKKIVFYDKRNHDLAFDYSARKNEAAFAAMLRNCHEGMEYLVSFTVAGTGSLGEIMGELIEFTPLVLSKIPYVEGAVPEGKGRKAE